MLARCERDRRRRGAGEHDRAGLQHLAALGTSRAAATSERKGWPRIAALEPNSRGRPSTDRTMPRLSIAVSRLFQGPTMKPVEDALSAITSGRENLKFS